MSQNSITTSPSVEYYDRDPAYFAERFSRTSFAEVHAGWIGFLPTAGSSILDVGAGSGRDAAALEVMGYDVTAIEPSPSLRKWAKRRYPESQITWLDDNLPDLELVRNASRRFAFILCSAVLMHLSLEEVERSFRSMAELLTPSGFLAVSLRDRQHFEPPALFHDIDHSAVLVAAARAGLGLIHSTETLDQLKRSGVVWRSYVFSR